MQLNNEYTYSFVDVTFIETVSKECESCKSAYFVFPFDVKANGRQEPEPPKRLVHFLAVNGFDYTIL